jgi:nickel transport protein
MSKKTILSRHWTGWNVNRKGTAVLVGHLQEPIETVKAEGSNRSLKIKREKFAKGLIGVSGDDDRYKKASGQKLEIVPESNVMKTRVGEEITLEILLDGKPLKSQVYATYDGFSRRSMTFAYATENLDDSISYVKVTSPGGVWMVRVEKRIETNARDFDLLSLKATFVFSVQ